MRLCGAARAHRPQPNVDPDRLPKLAAAIGAEKPVKGSKRYTKRKKRRRVMPRAPPPDASAFTVEAFCAQHMLSRAMYYKLKLKGLGPREIRLGNKILISKEAAAGWRAAREAETAKKEAAE